MKNSLDITTGKSQDVQVRKELTVLLWDVAEAADMDEVCLGFLEEQEGF